MVVWSPNGRAKPGSAWFSLKSTDFLKVTPSLTHKHTQAHKQHIPGCLCILFDFGAWRSLASPFGGSSALSFRNQGAGTDPHSHHASESPSCLLNTDTNPQTHTHMHRLLSMPTTTVQTVWALRTHCVSDWRTNSLLLSLLSAPQNLNTAPNLIRAGLFSFEWGIRIMSCSKNTQKHSFTDILPAGWRRREEKVDRVTEGLGFKLLTYIKG